MVEGGPQASPIGGFRPTGAVGGLDLQSAGGGGWSQVSPTGGFRPTGAVGGLDLQSAGGGGWAPRLSFRRLQAYRCCRRVRSPVSWWWRVGPGIFYRRNEAHRCRVRDRSPISRWSVDPRHHLKEG